MSEFDERGRPEADAAARRTADLSGNQGGTNWYSPSFSQRTGLFYVSAWEDYASIYAGAVAGAPGRSRTSSAAAPRNLSAVPGAPGWGAIADQHMDRGGRSRRGDRARPRDRASEVEVQDDRRHRRGILTTGSDLLFTGGREGYFQALDARDGRATLEDATWERPSTAARSAIASARGRYRVHRVRALDVCVRARRVASGVNEHPAGRGPGRGADRSRGLGRPDALCGSAEPFESPDGGVRDRVLSPFVLIILLDSASPRWPSLFAAALHGATLAVTLISLIAYTARILRPPQAQAAFVFVVVHRWCWWFSSSGRLRGPRCRSAGSRDRDVPIRRGIARSGARRPRCGGVAAGSSRHCWISATEGAGDVEFVRRCRAPIHARGRSDRLGAAGGTHPAARRRRDGFRSSIAKRCSPRREGDRSPTSSTRSIP